MTIGALFPHKFTPTAQIIMDGEKEEERNPMPSDYTKSTT
jgi:hypothetical protein